MQRCSLPCFWVRACGNTSSLERVLCNTVHGWFLWFNGWEECWFFPSKYSSNKSFLPSALTNKNVMSSVNAPRLSSVVTNNVSGACNRGDWTAAPWARITCNSYMSLSTTSSIHMALEHYLCMFLAYINFLTVCFYMFVGVYIY